MSFSNFFKNHVFEWIALMASACGSVVTILAFSVDLANKQPEASFTKQIEQLDKVQKSLNTLSVFVSEQKKHLKQSQQTIENLKSEQEKLQPIIDADKKIVETLLSLQAEKNRSNIWGERLIGLFLGVAGSLIASLIWAFFKNKDT
jgi:hypothetical protein